MRADSKRSAINFLTLLIQYMIQVYDQSLVIAGGVALCSTVHVDSLSLLFHGIVIVPVLISHISGQATRKREGWGGGGGGGEEEGRGGWEEVGSRITTTEC